MKGFWLEMLPRFGVGFAAGFLPWLVYRYPQQAASLVGWLRALPQGVLPTFTVAIFLTSGGFMWRKALAATASAEKPTVPVGWLSPVPKWSLISGLSVGIAVAACFSGDKEIFSIAATFSLCSLFVVWMACQIQDTMNRSLQDDKKTRSESIRKATRLMYFGITSIIAAVAGAICLHA